MRKLAVFTVLFALPLSVKAEDETAKKLAQEILDKGSALFDRHDAAAMAATYTEDAQLFWLQKDDSTGEIKVTNKNGRAEIEELYRDVFKNPGDQKTSKNNVEFARFATPDVLIIEGVFQPNVDKQGKFPFVQVRIKRGDKWLMKTLQFFVMSQD
jgi:hypothetical protein